MKYILLFEFCILCATQVTGQGCGVSGLSTPKAVLINPSCGPTLFIKDSVPKCSTAFSLPKICTNSGISYKNRDPTWYHFFCLKSGTLKLMITPKNNSDDYNWMLFDVTGKPWSPEVLKDPSLIVGGNWSSQSGKTGTSSDANTTMVCPSSTNPSLHYSSFSLAPHLKKTHSYLLLVSHYKGDRNDGYKLSLRGGTAVIADTLAPLLKKGVVACDGRSITVFLNTDTINTIPHHLFIKGITSSSLATDGSDFKLLHTKIRIKSATTNSTGLNMTKFTLHLDGQLKPGFYTLVIQKGNDGNTLLDKCGKSIPPDDTLRIVKQYVPPMTMRSIVPLKCISKSIKVVFVGNIKCNSIAKDGSDFSIINVNTGKHLMIERAEGVDCKNGLTDTVQIYLNTPIIQTGKFHLVLKKGSDDNSTISRCDVVSPPGQKLTFESFGIIADIHSILRYECNKVTVILKSSRTKGGYKWDWSSSSGKTSYKDSFSFIDTTFKTQTIKLKVSNGSCNAEDNIQLKFNKDYYLHADFTLPPFVCPQDPVQLKDKSKGAKIMQWNWNLGNGKYSHLKNPSIQHYPTTTFTKKYPIKLTTINSKGCKDTITKSLKVSNTCKVYVPTAFTPDNDGENDYLHPLNAFLTKNLSFKIYNRFGQLVYQTTDWTRGWNGSFHGKPQPEGSYIWILSFVNSKTGKEVSRKGATLLIR